MNESFENPPKLKDDKADENKSPSPQHDDAADDQPEQPEPDMPPAHEAKQDNRTILLKENKYEKLLTEEFKKADENVRKTTTELEKLQVESKLDTDYETMDFLRTRGLGACAVQTVFRHLKTLDPKTTSKGLPRTIVDPLNAENKSEVGKTFTDKEGLELFRQGWILLGMLPPATPQEFSERLKVVEAATKDQPDPPEVSRLREHIEQLKQNKSATISIRLALDQTGPVPAVRDYVAYTLLTKGIEDFKKVVASDQFIRDLRQLQKEFGGPDLTDDQLQHMKELLEAEPR